LKISLIALLVCLTGLPLLAADPAPVTLKGHFVWKNNGPDKNGDLRAEFTPVKEGEWTVSFHFIWKEEPMIYTGLAKGSLKNGSLTGEVKSGDKEHSYTFKGTVTNGKLTAIHNYLDEDGTVSDTGTIVLNPS